MPLASYYLNASTTNLQVMGANRFSYNSRFYFTTVIVEQLPEVVIEAKV